jgi:hypothetical protein
MKYDVCEDDEQDCTSLACEAKKLSPELQRWGSDKHKLESRRDGTDSVLSCLRHSACVGHLPSAEALG